MCLIAYLVPPLSVESLASRQLLKSIEKFSVDMGLCVEGNVRRDLRNPFEEIMNKRALIFLRKLEILRRLLFSYIKYKAVVIPYSTSFFNPLSVLDVKYLLRPMEKLLSKVRAILYVYDSPVLQRFIFKGVLPSFSLDAESRFLNKAHAIMVFNSYFAKFLEDVYGVDRERIFEFQLLDDFVEFMPPRDKKLNFPSEIIWIGNLSNFKAFTGNIGQIKNAVFSVYGYGHLSEKPTNLRYKGLILDENSLSLKISKADFGLLAYPKDFADYMLFGTSMKFSTYVVSGLPIITMSNLIYPAEIVKKYNIGWVFSSLENLNDFLENLNEKDYNRKRDNVLELAKKIRSGYFFKKALREVAETL